MMQSLHSPFHLKSVTLSVGRQSPTKFEQFQAKSPAFQYNLPPVTSRNQYDHYLKPSVRLRNQSQMSNVFGFHDSIDQDQKHIFQARNEEANKLVNKRHRFIKDHISQSVKVNNPIVKRRINEIEFLEKPKVDKSIQLGIIKSRFTQESEQSEQDNMTLSQQLTNIRKFTISQEMVSQRYEPKRFKVVLQCIRAALRLSSKYRLLEKKRQKESQIFELMKKPHQSYLQNFEQEQIQKQNEKFVEAVAMKMIAQMKQKEYIYECQQIWQKMGDVEKDIRRTRFCVLSFTLLQSLEFLTRKDNLPWLIQHQLNMSLFFSKDRQVSQFVTNRSELFSQSNLSMSQQCQLLIASEFFFFEFLSNNLVKVFNNIKTSSAFHKNQTLYYCVSMFNLLQTLFVKYFKHVKGNQKQKATIIPIQRKLKIQTDTKTEQVQLQLISVSKLEDDENQIIFGEFQANQIPGILKERKKWGQKVFKLFSQVCSNLQLQINI